MNLSSEMDDRDEGEGLVLDAEEECDVVPLRPGA